MRTMAQKRAEYALERVIQATKNLSKEERDKFASFVSGAPAMILQNGFGQTLAFWLTKGPGKYLALFDIVVKWLSFKDKDINNSFATRTDGHGFMEELSAMQQRQYLAVQNEALALLEWVKRFAHADLS